MPRHVSQRTVDEEEEENHKEHIGREAHTLSKRARNQRRRDDGELHLEQGKERQRDGGTTQDVACRRCIDLGTYVLEHQERQRITNNTSNIVAKAQREANDYPEH